MFENFYSHFLWNIQFKQFFLIIFLYSPEIKKKLNELVETLKKKLKSKFARQLKAFTQNDFILMEKYQLVFEPIARALDVLQREKDNSQGWIIPVLQSMKLRTSLIEESNNIVRDFKNILIKIIDKRFGHYLEINASNKTLLLAAVTHPRFKSSFIMDKENEDFVKDILVEECKQMCDDTNRDTVGTNVDDPVQHDIAQPERNSQQDDFIITFATDNNARRKSIENQIETEVSSFLVDSRKEVEMLNDYRYIKSVYYKYNTTLSSSAPIERVFSLTKMIFTPSRNRISADNFEKTIMLKHNECN